VYVACHGRHKPLIGQHDTETTAGQTQQLLIVLSATDVLPKIDDDVDNMLGLAELYQSVRTAALKQQRQPQLVSIFTAELFAYYLHIKYLSVTESGQFIRASSAREFERYENCIKQLMVTSAVYR